ncbi:hypothetical protein H6P81_011946 [Aristolochia fimbriata]|uniref:Uncharacterized protein n=1 Tax=Aristolochia fimbriata TaxID=158543 RepID=A0AAV7EF08_ARIFI|nr:hypothetical protein H6P81_011946 [Aristolochia fimbriata]
MAETQRVACKATVKPLSQTDTCAHLLATFNPAPGTSQPKFLAALGPVSGSIKIIELAFYGVLSTVLTGFSPFSCRIATFNPPVRPLSKAS